MDRVEKLLLNYLETDTNYAILLTGAWGSGKTHFIKNTFFDKVKSIKSIGSGATKNYKPILVSLFGVKSIDDIKDKILLSIIPLLENKELNKALTIFKGVIKSVDITKLISSVGFLENITDNVIATTSELKKQKKNNLSFDNVVIFFDDLERINSKYLMEDEILGFINSLVEHENNKVVIIANDNKIASETFEELKEKTIGKTIYFEQDFELVFNDIIQNYNTTDAYKEFLKENLTTIKIILKKGVEKVNYRILKYFLSNFSQFYHYISNDHHEIKDLTSQKVQILDGIMRFTLGITIEHCLGKISHSNTKKIDKANEHIYSSYLSFGVKGDYISELSSKYFENIQHNWFYGSVFEVVTGLNIFNQDKLLNELKQKFNVFDDLIPERYKVYNKLYNSKYTVLDDKEYLELTKSLKKFALSGEYKPIEYPIILMMLLRDDNLLNLDPNNITSQFLKVIKRVKHKHIYDANIEMYLSASKENLFYDYILKINLLILKINQENKQKELVVASNELKELMLGDFDNFAKYFEEIKLRRPIQIKDFSFVSMSGAFLYSFFNKCSNHQKSEFIKIVNEWFSQYYFFIEISELESLRGLSSKVKQKLKKGSNKNISMIHFRDLNKVLDSAIHKIEEYYNSTK